MLDRDGDRMSRRDCGDARWTDAEPRRAGAAGRVGVEADAEVDPRGRDRCTHARAADADPERRFPSIYLLQGLTGQVRAWFNVSPFVPTFPQLVEEANVDAVIVLLDAFTALGGSQFIDSPSIGHYGTYLTDEVVPFVDVRFRTLPDPAHRGLQGKSSGGFGAMVWGMLRPDLFGAFATHAGDALFEVSALPTFPAAAQAPEPGDGEGTHPCKGTSAGSTRGSCGGSSSTPSGSPSSSHGSKRSRSAKNSQIASLARNLSDGIPARLRLRHGVADRRGVVVPSISLIAGETSRGSSARIVRSHG
jgi:hypothetical protein